MIWVERTNWRIGGENCVALVRIEVDLQSSMIGGLVLWHYLFTSHLLRPSITVSSQLDPHSTSGSF